MNEHSCPDAFLYTLEECVLEVQRDDLGPEAERSPKRTCEAAAWFEIVGEFFGDQTGPFSARASEQLRQNQPADSEPRKEG